MINNLDFIMDNLGYVKKIETFDESVQHDFEKDVKTTFCYYYEHQNGDCIYESSLKDIISELNNSYSLDDSCSCCGTTLDSLGNCPVDCNPLEELKK